MIDLFVTVFSITLLLLCGIAFGALYFLYVTRRTDDFMDNYSRKSKGKDFDSQEKKTNQNPPENRK